MSREDKRVEMIENRIDAIHAEVIHALKTFKARVNADKGRVDTINGYNVWDSCPAMLVIDCPQRWWFIRGKEKISRMIFTVRVRSGGKSQTFRSRKDGSFDYPRIATMLLIAVDYQKSKLRAKQEERMQYGKNNMLLKALAKFGYSQDDSNTITLKNDYRDGLVLTVTGLNNKAWGKLLALVAPFNLKRDEVRRDGI